MIFSSIRQIVAGLSDNLFYNCTTAFTPNVMRTLQMFFFCLLFNSVAAQRADTLLRISHLTGDFYVFETYSYYQGSRIPANGMYVLTTAGAVLFDSPWDTTQFQPLLDTIKARHNQPVVICIATHFHEDRTAGLEYFSQQGIRTYTTRLTDELSRKHGMKRAKYIIDRDTVFKVGQYSFQVFHPGHGHTPDNVVAWFKDQRILYGGCLIKSADDKNLGNLADASRKKYATTLQNVQRKCPNPLYIIPGHNSWRSATSLQHSIRMAQELKKQAK
jgi:metallo-beta-lactamase class B